MLECFTDKSETAIIDTEFVYRTSIVDKYRKYLFRILHSFYESRIVMNAEILTEDEESSRVHKVYGIISLEKNQSSRTSKHIRYSKGERDLLRGISQAL